MGTLGPSRDSLDSSPPVSLALRQDRTRLLLWFFSLVAPLVGISFEACGRTWGKLGQPYFNLYVPHTRNCLSIAHGILRATYAPNIGIDLPGNKLLVVQSRNSTSRPPQRPALPGPQNQGFINQSEILQNCNFFPILSFPQKHLSTAVVKLSNAQRA